MDDTLPCLPPVVELDSSELDEEPDFWREIQRWMVSQPGWSADCGA